MLMAEANFLYFKTQSRLLNDPLNFKNAGYIFPYCLLVYNLIQFIVEHNGYIYFIYLYDALKVTVSLGVDRDTFFEIQKTEVMLHSVAEANKQFKEEHGHSIAEEEVKTNV